MRELETVGAATENDNISLLKNDGEMVNAPDQSDVNVEENVKSEGSLSEAVNGVEHDSTQPDDNTSARSDYPEPRVITNPVDFEWVDGTPASEQYPAFGEVVAARGDIYRSPNYGDGLIQASDFPNIPPMPISTSDALTAVIVDRVRVSFTKNGTLKGIHIPAVDLKAMLRASKNGYCHA
jgi:hypothetical protein